MNPLHLQKMPNRRRVFTRMEAGIALLVSLGLCLTWILLPGGEGGLYRLPWLDELHSIRIMQDNSASSIVRALMAGADQNPPVYHLLGHALLRIAHLQPIPALRIMSLVFMAGAMFFTYLTLWRATGRTAALIGILALWSHPMASRYAFEARFYAPWAAFAAGTLWFATSRRDNCTIWNAWGLAVFAALLCTIHYFGVVSLALIGLGFLFLPWNSIRHFRATLWPGGLGPLALAVCLPILHRQKTAYAAATWVDPPDFSGSIAYLLSQSGIEPIAVIAIFMGITTAFSLRRVVRRSAIPGPEWIPAAALLLMPGLLVLFSYLVQPALIDRYSIPVLIGIAGLCAYLASGVGKIFQPVVMAGLFVLGIYSFQRVQAEVMAEAREHKGRANILASVHDPLPVVFSRRHHQWPAIFAQPEIEPRAYYLFLRDVEMPWRNNTELIERDLARIFHAYYGLPPLMSLAEARTHSVLLFVSRDHQGVDIPSLFPGFQTEPLGCRVFKLTRNAADSPGGT